MLIKFITILSIASAIISFFIILISLYATGRYRGSIQETLDHIEGQQAEWPITGYVILFISSTCWLITIWLN